MRPLLCAEAARAVCIGDQIGERRRRISCHLWRCRSRVLAARARVAVVAEQADEQLSRTGLDDHVGVRHEGDVAEDGQPVAQHKEVVGRHLEAPRDDHL